jgi:hypothetical protein
MFWPTVSRPVNLGVGHPFRTHDQILLFPFYFSGKLLCSSAWGALSDERTGLYFVVQSVSGESRGGLITIRYCLIRDYWVTFPSPVGMVAAWNFRHGPRRKHVVTCCSPVWVGASVRCWFRCSCLVQVCHRILFDLSLWQFLGNTGFRVMGFLEIDINLMWAAYAVVWP